MKPLTGTISSVGVRECSAAGRSRSRRRLRRADTVPAPVTSGRAVLTRVSRNPAGSPACAAPTPTPHLLTRGSKITRRSQIDVAPLLRGEASAVVFGRSMLLRDDCQALPRLAERASAGVTFSSRGCARARSRDEYAPREDRGVSIVSRPSETPGAIRPDDAYERGTRSARSPCHSAARGRRDGEQTLGSERPFRTFLDNWRTNSVPNVLDVPSCRFNSSVVAGLAPVQQGNRYRCGRVRSRLHLRRV